MHAPVNPAINLKAVENDYVITVGFSRPVICGICDKRSATSTRGFKASAAGTSKFPASEIEGDYQQRLSRRLNAQDKPELAHLMR